MRPDARPAPHPYAVPRAYEAGAARIAAGSALAGTMLLMLAAVLRL